MGRRGPVRYLVGYREWCLLEMGRESSFGFMIPGVLGRAARLVIPLMFALLGSALCRSATLDEPQPNHLPASLRDEFTLQPPTNQNVVVLIHGWNRNNLANMYTGEWESLLLALKSTLENSGWSLVVYHWEADAFRTNPRPARQGVPEEIDAALARQATLASASAHGLHLAGLLANGFTRSLHVICHDVGAVIGATLINQWPTGDKLITLLDPYLPFADPYLGSVSSRETSLFRNASVPWAFPTIEYYFSSETDGATRTHEVLSDGGSLWRADLNLCLCNLPGVSFGETNPIRWYRSTVQDVRSHVRSLKPTESISGERLAQPGFWRSLATQDYQVSRIPAVTDPLRDLNLIHGEEHYFSDPFTAHARLEIVWAFYSATNSGVMTTLPPNAGNNYSFTAWYPGGDFEVEAQLYSTNAIGVRQLVTKSNRAMVRVLPSTFDSGTLAPLAYYQYYQRLPDAIQNPSLIRIAFQTGMVVNLPGNQLILAPGVIHPRVPSELHNLGTIILGEVPFAYNRGFGADEYDASSEPSFAIVNNGLIALGLSRAWVAPKVVNDVDGEIKISEGRFLGSLENRGRLELTGGGDVETHQGRDTFVNAREGTVEVPETSQSSIIGLENLGRLVIGNGSPTNRVRLLRFTQGESGKMIVRGGVVELLEPGVHDLSGLIELTEGATLIVDVDAGDPFSNALVTLKNKSRLTLPSYAQFPELSVIAQGESRIVLGKRAGDGSFSGAFTYNFESGARYSLLDQSFIEVVGGTLSFPSRSTLIPRMRISGKVHASGTPRFLDLEMYSGVLAGEEGLSISGNITLNGGGMSRVLFTKDCTLTSRSRTMSLIEECHNQGNILLEGGTAAFLEVTNQGTVRIQGFSFANLGLINGVGGKVWLDEGSRLVGDMGILNSGGELFMGSRSEYTSTTFYSAFSQDFGNTILMPNSKLGGWWAEGSHAAGLVEGINFNGGFVRLNSGLLWLSNSAVAFGGADFDAPVTLTGNGRVSAAAQFSGSVSISNATLTVDGPIEVLAETQWSIESLNNPFQATPLITTAREATFFGSTKVELGSAIVNQSLNEIKFIGASNHLFLRGKSPPFELLPTDTFMEFTITEDQMSLTLLQPEPVRTQGFTIAKSDSSSRWSAPATGTVDSNGEFLISVDAIGNSSFTSGVGPDELNSFLARYDAAGQLRWQIVLTPGSDTSELRGGSGFAFPHNVSCFVFSIFGTAHLGDQLLGSDGQYSFFLVWFDAAGKQIRTRKITLDGNLNAWNVAANPTGGLGLLIQGEGSLSSDGRVILGELSGASLTVILPDGSVGGSRVLFPGITDISMSAMAFASNGRLAVSASYDGEFSFADRMISAQIGNSFLASWTPEGVEDWIIPPLANASLGPFAFTVDGSDELILSGTAYESGVLFSKLISPVPESGEAFVTRIGAGGVGKWLTRVKSSYGSQPRSIKALASGESFALIESWGATLIGNRAIPEESGTNVFLARISADGSLVDSEILSHTSVNVSLDGGVTDSIAVLGYGGGSVQLSPYNLALGEEDSTHAYWGLLGNALPYLYTQLSPSQGTMELLFAASGGQYVLEESQLSGGALTWRKSDVPVTVSGGVGRASAKISGNSRLFRLVRL